MISKKLAGVRTRIAPSPTGWLHIGTARAALFNYLFARRHGGSFVVRIEDTDLERSDKKFEADILEGLSWLGIEWDEGPIVDTRNYKGDYGPYRQTERLDSYEHYLNKLLEQGRVFYCAHTAQELEIEHRAQMETKQALRHICAHRDASNTEGIIRFKNTASGCITFTDCIRGAISFNTELLGDFSLAKNIRAPLYNFAVVIDDKEMAITHVLRGEDHIPNTPKQILIQDALAFERPLYAHLPLILGPDRSKLSKRHGETSLNAYRHEGYLGQALVNFIALLGWNPDDEREIFSLDELEKEFSLEKVQKSGAVFNKEKLQWLNGEYIRRMDRETLAANLYPFLQESFGNIPQDILHRVAKIEQPRLKTFADVQALPFLFKDPSYEKELLLWKGIQEPVEAATHLRAIEKILCDIKDFEKTLMPYAEQHGKGNVLWPLRVALSGQAASPGPFEIMYVIGKEATLRRVRNAIALLK
ncbi:MAG: glutamyl-tRNA synthetase [Parcubacteria group bacterium Gr01-1014_29]|nr:MAG: glutamyl-tRNA synthetase [Parcubacteria group bacterium Gr01-1014_29]